MANTHVHVPPNFSAFESVEDAVSTAAREGVAVVGLSNFYDLGVYGRFGAAAERAGIVPLYGIELIALLDAEQRDGIRVNDPENPGRMYICGKGIAALVDPRQEALDRLAANRSMAEWRMRRMATALRESFAAAGLPTDLDHDTIADEVAERAGVPRTWVVLQERHLAQAFQAALFREFAPDGRRRLLERAFDRPPTADPDDPVAVQREIRSRLTKAGGPAFVPESPLPFDDAVGLILGLGGIPCYPTLADGAAPTCPWEDPPAALAERLLSRGIHAAELIPVRNRPEVVDAYVVAFRRAGIVVMAGTEHNTTERIPLEPRCSDGTRPSPAAREAFWEGACVVAAHQHLRASGRPGFVDERGRLAGGFADDEARIRRLSELGAELIAGRTVGAAS